MKVCFVCCEYPPGTHGGIGASTQNLARALVADGHEVRVVGMYRKERPDNDYDEDKGVRVWRMAIPRHRFGWASARFKLYRRVAKWSKLGLVDLIDVPDWEGWSAGWPRLSVPVISRLCGASCYFSAELGRPFSQTMFRLERAALRRSDYWCSKSVYMADKTQQLFRLTRSPDAIVYNCVESPQRAGDARRKKNRVIFTGTLTPKKGVISLIKAWPQVLMQDSSAELHLFGKDGRTDCGQSMQKYLSSLLSSEDRASVNFHGHVSRGKITEELLQSGIAVFPSLAEGFANSPLEAMACGCATIYSRPGSGPELIDDSRNGLLVDPNCPMAISDAIVRLLRDDELRDRLGEAGRRHVRARFSTQKILAKNLAFYDHCLQRFSASSRRTLRASP